MLKQLDNVRVVNNGLYFIFILYYFSDLRLEVSMTSHITVTNCHMVT